MPGRATPERKLAICSERGVARAGRAHRTALLSWPPTRIPHGPREGGGQRAADPAPDPTVLAALAAHRRRAGDVRLLRRRISPQARRGRRPGPKSRPAPSKSSARSSAISRSRRCRSCSRTSTASVRPPSLVAALVALRGGQSVEQRNQLLQELQRARAGSPSRHSPEPRRPTEPDKAKRETLLQKLAPHARRGARANARSREAATRRLLLIRDPCRAVVQRAGAAIPPSSPSREVESFAEHGQPWPTKPCA